VQAGITPRARREPTREELLVQVAQLRRELAEEREAVALFRALAEESPSMIFLYDLAHRRLTYVNPRYEEALGYRLAELAEPGFDFFRLIAPESVDAVRRSHDSHRRGEDHLPFEYTMLARDGTRLDVFLCSRVIELRGSPAVLGVISDVTAQHRLAADLARATGELERQNAELRALDRTREAFVRDVSHELKTPVAKQAMQLEILRTLLGTECRWRVAQTLRVMEETVHRQQRVIRNLLDLARLETGRQPFLVGPVRLDEVVLRVLEDYRPALEAAAVAIERCVEPLEVLADGELLWHVVSNLVNNAVKFARPDGPRRIAVASGRDGAAALLRITDNGAGLDEEELERAFERFYRAPGATEGSGVGLCICRALVEGMGGTVRLESPGRGRGATATVSLPMAPRP